MKIAVATQGLILVRTTHKHLLIMVTMAIAEETRSSITASTTERSESVHSIRKRNTVQDLTELAPVGISIQTH